MAQARKLEPAATTVPPEVIEVMARAINGNGWRDPAKCTPTEVDMLPAWRAKATFKALMALAAAADAGWTLTIRESAP